MCLRRRIKVGDSLRVRCGTVDEDGAAHYDLFSGIQHPGKAPSASATLNRSRAPKHPSRTTRVLILCPMAQDKLALNSPGILFAMASAFLFGASTPLAKLMLGEGVDAWLLAGLLYFFSGVGLGAVLLARRLLGTEGTEAPLRIAPPKTIIDYLLTIRAFIEGRATLTHPSLA
jgi:hypothetical protein